ncbi:MAG: hypothetical protein VX223_09445 [Myxococcota bacterium]|nr:hypothetical protein [Myxococcota bacterium]
MKASSGKKLLILVNLLGGVAVLGSYAWGLTNYPSLRGALWGGVPEAIRPLYTVNMLLATGGWISIALHLLRGPNDMHVGNRPAHLLFAIIQMLILLPSAFWMPLTLVVIQQGGSLPWTMTRLCLSMVGVGAVLQVWAVWELRPKPNKAAVRAVLVGGAVAFALQTAVLDAIVWPHYFVIP